ncbi:hypothetical protein VNO77_23065 [Canavalia gladiata]|uniref:Uncharacterized protein n=1 Tax=Canavalia gladiata TaxID=3824 RepID=A0AAN9L6C3_CANGL
MPIRVHYTEQPILTTFDNALTSSHSLCCEESLYLRCETEDAYLEQSLYLKTECMPVEGFLITSLWERPLSNRHFSSYMGCPPCKTSLIPLDQGRGDKEGINANRSAGRLFLFCKGFFLALLTHIRRSTRLPPPAFSVSFADRELPKTPYSHPIVLHTLANWINPRRFSDHVSLKDVQDTTYSNSFFFSR